ncbi:MAG: hypothetical protein Alpg2KO_09650 [Alphaproteobacteria bacterium]
MARNNRWDSFTSEQPSHLSVTYHDSVDGFAGLELILKSEQIAYFRPHQGGTRIMIRRPGNKFKGYNISETPDQLLSLLGQPETPDHATAIAKGLLPDEPLAANRFICSTVSSHDELATGSALYFRIDGPDVIRESRLERGEAAIVFDDDSDDPFLFGLQQSASQLFELAGRPKPKSVRDLQVEPKRPHM